MKPKTLFLILLSLLLTFSCEDDTPTNDDVDDMMSLDWILLKKGVDTNFNVESCDGYEGYDCEGGNVWDSLLHNECGEYRLDTYKLEVVESCSGYELCEMGWNGWWFYSNISQYDCCYEYEWYANDSLGNIIDTEIRYKNTEYLFNEYKLYWNKDLSVCSDNYCAEDDFELYDYYYDIVIPLHIPKYETNDCDGDEFDCEREDYFHPNCDTPLDTTMMIGSKSVSFEKMGWFDRGDDNDFGYIHYYPLDDYLTFDWIEEYGEISDGLGEDISSWKIVDYQRKD